MWVTEVSQLAASCSYEGREPARPIDIVVFDATQVTLSPALPGSGLPKGLGRVNSLFAAMPQFMHN